MKLLVFLFLLLSLGSALAENWTTTDGITYQDVKVTSLDAVNVTIIHHEGGVVIPLAKLSSDLQKRFGYEARAIPPRTALAPADPPAKTTRSAPISSQEAAPVAIEVPARKLFPPPPPPETAPPPAASPPVVAAEVAPSPVADNRAEVEALKADYEDNLKKAKMARSEFDNSSYISENGQLEHSHTNSSRPFFEAAQEDLRKIQALQGPAPPAVTPVESNSQFKL